MSRNMCFGVMTYTFYTTNEYLSMVCAVRDTRDMVYTSNGAYAAIRDTPIPVVLCIAHYAMICNSSGFAHLD